MSDAVGGSLERCPRCGGIDFDGGGGCIYCNGKNEPPPTDTVADKEAIRARNRRDGVYDRLAAQGRYIEDSPP